MVCLLENALQLAVGSFLSIAVFQEGLSLGALDLVEVLLEGITFKLKVGNVASFSQVLKQVFERECVFKESRV